MRGATCWTDHYLVRTKLRLSLTRRKSCTPRKPLAVHTLTREEQRDEYECKLSEMLRENPPSDTTEGGWETLKKCIVSTAEAVLGRGRTRQPDWFSEAADCLTPLLNAKRAAHSRVLHNDSPANRKEFRKHQRAVKQAVFKAKEDWIWKVANEAAQAKKDGKQRWKSVRQLQMAFAGRRPTRPSAVLKVDGEVTKTPEETKQRWYEHFNSILNIHSHFHQEVIDDIPSYPTMHDLDDPPTQGELVSALGKLKKGKVGGETEIVAELILNGGQELRDRLKSLLQRVWREGTVVEDWKHAELVPIPKKGDLKHCDNWRGISLLDVVGKVFARVIQERLQIIAEKYLPESQCGFRKGRGCTDMIFTARQLVEKCIEHNDSLFILFVDLKKAYDTVPRSALWCVLEKCGVPPTMLRIIRSFHDGMRASVRVGDLRTADIEVKNGLRQGCVLAPTLFNMYFGAVVAYWRERCPQVGVTVKYKIARKLVGDRTAKSRLSEVRVTESQFADDVAVYATTQEAFEIATTEFVSAASKFGLTVSIQKTKGLAVGRQLTPRDQAPVQLEEGTIELVPDFTYLGSNITSDGEVKSEVKIRIGKAARAFGCLQKSIFQNQRVSVEVKRVVYKAVVLSILLYGAETWAVKAESLRRMNGSHNRSLRSMMGVSKLQQWKERITSRSIATAFGMEEKIADILIARRLQWLGHLARMDPSRLPKQLLFGEFVKKRPSHGVKRRWRDVVVADLRAVGISEEEWYQLAQERKAWKAFCKEGLSPLVGAEGSEAGVANLSRSNRTGMFPCPCGRVFRRKGDRTRHSRFCVMAATQDP